MMLTFDQRDLIFFRNQLNNDDLIALFDSAHADLNASDRYTVALTLAQAEQLQDRVGEWLAQDGIDQDGEINTHGRYLETLIDRLQSQ